MGFCLICFYLFLSVFLTCEGVNSLPSPPSRWEPVLERLFICQEFDFPPDCRNVIASFFNSGGEEGDCLCDLLSQPSLAMKDSDVYWLSTICLHMDEAEPKDYFSVQYTSEAGSSRQLQEDTAKKCNSVIPSGSCLNDQCCYDICSKHFQNPLSLEASYHISNGNNQCLCYAIYPEGSCPP